MLLAVTSPPYPAGAAPLSEHMKITVLYFAAVKERLGVPSESIEFAEEDELSAAALWTRLCARHPALEPMRRYLRLSVNMEMADDATRVRDGDEIGVIPPIAGGADTSDVLTENPIDDDEIISRVTRDDAGAVVTFRGVVRNHSKGKDVAWLEYEVYPEMAAAKLRQVIAEAEAAHPTARCALQHRYGHLEVGEAAVVIAVSSPHRAEAFAACSMAIDRIKEIVPIWKKEASPDGTCWVGMGS